MLTNRDQVMAQALGQTMSTSVVQKRPLACLAEMRVVVKVRFTMLPSHKVAISATLLRTEPSSSLQSVAG